MIHSIGVRSVRHAAVFCLGMAVAGCLPGGGGDFGRIPPLLVTDDMHAWVAADATGEPASPLPLTSDERLLRDLAYPLIVEPYERDRLTAVVHEYGIIKPPPRGTYDREAYANYLLGTPRRSPASAYARLIDDVRDDITRLPQFFAVAARVRDIDEKRRKSLFYVSSVSPAERAGALQRMKENAAVIEWVRERLTSRVASYRLALERLVVGAPDMQVVDAERAINELRDRAAFYRHHLPPPYVREQSLATAR